MESEPHWWVLMDSWRSDRKQRSRRSSWTTQGTLQLFPDVLDLCYSCFPAVFQMFWTYVAAVFQLFSRCFGLTLQLEFSFGYWTFSFILVGIKMWTNRLIGITLITNYSNQSNFVISLFSVLFYFSFKKTLLRVRDMLSVRSERVTTWSLLWLHLEAWWTNCSWWTDSSPVWTVAGVGDDLLHHQLRLPQLLLQLGQLEVGWRTRTRKPTKKSLNTEDDTERALFHLHCRLHDTEMTKLCFIPLYNKKTKLN